MADLPPNHHADYPQFTGVFGYLAGLTMTVGRGRDARLVADLGDVGPGDHVVDIGCGPGTAARVTARRGADVTGVDPSEPMLRLADLLSRFPRTSGLLEWRLAGAEDLGLDDGVASRCWSLASVHHWPELEPGISEVFRILVPGGMFMALEKRTEPGAKGNASHGWTDEQAVTFAEMLDQQGFERTVVANHDLGRRKVVVVTGFKPE